MTSCIIEGIYSKYLFLGRSVAIVQQKTNSADIYRAAVQHFTLFIL
jgi:hypothetical protein